MWTVVFSMIYADIELVLYRQIGMVFLYLLNIWQVEENQENSKQWLNSRADTLVIWKERRERLNTVGSD